MTEASELRRQAKVLEKKAWGLDKEEARQGKKYMVIEVIQDERRPRVSGPFTWDEAAAIVQCNPNTSIGDYGAVLP